MREKPTIHIQYCTGCKWMLRASWMAQELLSSFENDLSGVTLVPKSDGHFQIWADQTLVWCRKRDSGFPQASELKRRVRDAVLPEQSLGHCELTPKSEQ